MKKIYPWRPFTAYAFVCAAITLLSALMLHIAPSLAAQPKAGESSTIGVAHGDWSPWIKEANSDFSCGGNRFLVGRKHDGDEQGESSYLCAVAYQFQTLLTISEIEKSDAMKESYSDYTCPKNKVMVGRSHAHDENGDTWYYCGKLTGPLGDIEVAPGKLSHSQWEPQSELVCEGDTALVRRKHDDDENGDTWHACAELY